MSQGTGAGGGTLLRGQIYEAGGHAPPSSAARPAPAPGMPRLFDLGFGPQIQVYFLVAFWCLAAAAPMHGITRTPFGRMCNAVRDIAARVPYAGVTGGLAAINFEIADPAYFGAAQPGNALPATFVGGGRHFSGPVAGAILVTCLQTPRGAVTDVWQLYFGLMFMAGVIYLPGGIASSWTMQIPPWRAGRLARDQFRSPAPHRRRTGRSSGTATSWTCAARIMRPIPILCPATFWRAAR